MDESRRLSYRNRKKLGLTFSEAFVEAPASPQARSVDRGYASVMSSATPGQGDTQSEWDERHARIENRDGLSRLMDDLNKKDEAEAASEEIFVGEGGMKEAMLYGFIDELEKLGVLKEETSLDDVLLASFIDELTELGYIDKTAGLFRGSRGARTAIKMRQRGRGVMTPSGVARPMELPAAAKASGMTMEQWQAMPKQERLTMMQESPAASERAKALLTTTEKQSLLKGRGQKERLPSRKQLGARPQMVRPAAEPSPGEMAPAPVADPAAAQQAAAQAAAQQQAAALTAGAVPPAGAAQPNWLQRQWGAFSQPIAAGWRSGSPGQFLGGIGRGIMAAPGIGLPAAGLAGMALLPPALRAIGLGQREQHGVVPGMVSV